MGDMDVGVPGVDLVGIALHQVGAAQHHVVAQQRRHSIHDLGPGGQLEPAFRGDGAPLEPRVRSGGGGEGLGQCCGFVGSDEADGAHEAVTIERCFHA